MKSPRRTPALVALAAMVAACAVRPPAAAPAPAQDRWTRMSWEDRHDVMTFAVLPNMARTFQRFRGAADPDMTCATCHGADAEQVKYAMPHGLPALDPARMPDPHGSDPKEARMAKFMTEEVTPAMADLLGVPLDEHAGRLDRIDGGAHPERGFSCFNCHPSR